MKNSIKPRGLSTVAVIAVMLVATESAPEKKAPAPPPATTSDTYFNTNGVNVALLWATQSAEYEALCLQAYNAASAYMRAAVAEKGLSVDGKPVAVVLDLDETVLDNWSYFTPLHEAGKGVEWDDWAEWERDCGCNVKLVPGALDFITLARKLGVTVLFISNREDPRREQTIATLVQLGVVGSAAEVSGENAHRLQLYTDTSDKNPRRAVITAKYHVIAWLGDNLGDFPGGFAAKDGSARKAEVERDKANWGAGWFVFPNPMYGKWLKYLDAKDPESALPRPGDCGGKCKFPE